MFDGAEVGATGGDPLVAASCSGHGCRMSTCYAEETCLCDDGFAPDACTLCEADHEGPFCTPNCGCGTGAYCESLVPGTCLCRVGYTYDMGAAACTLTGLAGNLIVRPSLVQPGDYFQVANAAVITVPVISSTVDNGGVDVKATFAWSQTGGPPLPGSAFVNGLDIGDQTTASLSIKANVLFQFSTYTFQVAVSSVPLAIADEPHSVSFTANAASAGTCSVASSGTAAQVDTHDFTCASAFSDPVRIGVYARAR